MNGNSSKQVLLSILGIAILVVAVVGVSFAFFSYSKTGSTNNVISTGQIYTYLTTGENLLLQNAMPTSTPASVSATPADTNVAAMQFSVTGKNQSSEDITYKVYLVPSTVAAPSGKSVMLEDSDIGVMMTGTGEGAASELAATDVATLGGLAHGVLLGTGTFAAGSQETTHNYTVNMWVKSGLKISDTDTSVNGQATKYCAHTATGTPEAPNTTSGNYGCELYYPSGSTTVTPVPTTGLPSGGTYLPAYSQAYYQAKVRVVANTTSANINSGL